MQISKQGCSSARIALYSSKGRECRICDILGSVCCFLWPLSAALYYIPRRDPKDKGWQRIWGQMVCLLPPTQLWIQDHWPCLGHTAWILPCNCCLANVSRPSNGHTREKFWLHQQIQLSQIQHCRNRTYLLSRHLNLLPFVFQKTITFFPIHKYCISILPFYLPRFAAAALK